MPKVVIPDYPDSEIQQRKKLGLDLRDEIWEGVYHMSPSPTFEHQRIIREFISLLTPYCKKHNLGMLFPSVNVRDAVSVEQNYRVPDIVFIAKGRENIVTDGLWADSGPDLVVEIRSKDDETDAKTPFYEKVGTKELLIVDAESKEVELYRHRARRLVRVSPNVKGWLRCDSVRISVKKTGKKIRIRLEIGKTEHEI